MTNREIVEISTEPASLRDVAAVSAGATVTLTDDARRRIVESRRLLDEAIARGDAVYGATTGLGHTRDVRLPVDALRDLQEAFVELHVGALGDPLDTEAVRAGMAARLIGFARGGSGVSPALADGFVSLLNHRIHPLVPGRGSVGAGDLPELAIVARVLLGRGDVEVGGIRIPASRALESAGLDPVVFEGKDALSAIASNAMAVGRGALLVERLERLVVMADLVAGVSMEAMRANTSIIEPAVASVRGSDGQQAVSNLLRTVLTGSSRVGQGSGHSTQDPLSVRVVPQVHGAMRDLLARLAADLTAELNAPSDNPLVDVESGRILSNGNFHPMSVALTMESARVGLAHVGLLSDRRKGRLWDQLAAALGDVDTILSGDEFAAPRMAGFGLRYPAAARYTRLRHLANPVTLDIPPLDLGVEDHATNLSESTVLTEEAAEILEGLLAVEVLLAVAVLDSDGDGHLGGGTGSLVAAVTDELDEMPLDAASDELLVRVFDAIEGALDRVALGEVEPDPD